MQSNNNLTRLGPNHSNYLFNLFFAKATRNSNLNEQNSTFIRLKYIATSHGKDWLRTPKWTSIFHYNTQMYDYIHKA